MTQSLQFSSHEQLWELAALDPRVGEYMKWAPAEEVTKQLQCLFNEMREFMKDGWYEDAYIICCGILEINRLQEDKSSYDDCYLVKLLDEVKDHLQWLSEDLKHRYRKQKAQREEADAAAEAASKSFPNCTGRSRALARMFDEELHSDCLIMVSNTGIKAHASLLAVCSPVPESSALGLKAHKAVLSACSPVFETMFKEGNFLEAARGLVRINDFPYGMVRAMLDYIYTGAMNKELSMEDRVALLQIAAKYELYELKSHMEKRLAGEVSTENLCQLAFFADMQQSHLLKQACRAHLGCHTSKVFSTEGWEQIKRENPQFLIELFEQLHGNGSHSTSHHRCAAAKHTHLRKGMLAKMLEEGLHADCLIVIGDKQWSAHKAVLAAYSPVFEEMLALHEVIRIDDYSHTTVQAILNYLYTGKGYVSREEKECIALLQFAFEYRLAELKSHMEQIVARKLTAHNLCTLALLADQLHCLVLKQACLSYLAGNTAAVISTAEWQQMKHERSVFVTELLERLFVSDVVGGPIVKCHLTKT